MLAHVLIAISPLAHRSGKPIVQGDVREIFFLGAGLAIVRIVGAEADSERRTQIEVSKHAMKHVEIENDFVGFGNLNTFDYAPGIHIPDFLEAKKGFTVEASPF